MNNTLHLVVFGATGDLYQKKLASALFSLYEEGLLPAEFIIIGFARKPLSDAEFQNLTREAVLKKNGEADTGSFLKHFKYMQGDLEDQASFQGLGQLLKAEDEKRGICSNKLFYLAVPPFLYSQIFKNISEAGLAITCAPEIKDKETAWTRILVEKPFGKDIEEAKQLDRMLGDLFDESQIFRIDHYLAKETMQNILTFRFREGELESTWNKDNIERVRILFHEKDTVRSRGILYDGVGALRDVGQNHMLEMLAIVAMERPGSMDQEGIQREREKVLEQVVLKSIKTDALVRGQYEGYKNEQNINPNSQTETFFRVILGVNNERWAGVPFELEGGKALDKSEVVIEVCFKGSDKKSNNCQKFFISSDKSAYNSYGKVFYDALLGDQTIFTTTREVMAEWVLVTDIMNAWQVTPMVIYKQGSRAEDIK